MEDIQSPEDTWEPRGQSSISHSGGLVQYPFISIISYGKNMSFLAHLCSWHVFSGESFVETPGWAMKKGTLVGSGQYIEDYTTHVAKNGGWLSKTHDK